jgi:hypothetical protein
MTPTRKRTNPGREPTTNKFLHFGFGLRNLVAERFIHADFDGIALFRFCASGIIALLIQTRFILA